MLTTNDTGRIQPTLQRDNGISGTALPEVTLVVVGNQILQTLFQTARLVAVDQLTIDIFDTETGQLRILVSLFLKGLEIDELLDRKSVV